MKWSWGIPRAHETQRTKLLEKNWVPLERRMMSPLSVIVTVAIMFMTLFATVGFALLLDPYWKDWSRVVGLENSDFVAYLVVATLLVSSLVVLFVHEFVHALFFPKPFSNKVVIGSNGVFGFAYTEQQMTRGRYMFVASMPFLLSFVALYILSWFHAINLFTLFLCVINATGSSADIFTILFLLVKVPKGSQLRFLNSNGGELFYKK